MSDCHGTWHTIVTLILWSWYRYAVFQPNLPSMPTQLWSGQPSGAWS